MDSVGLTFNIDRDFTFSEAAFYLGFMTSIDSSYYSGDADQVQQDSGKLPRLGYWMTVSVLYGSMENY